MEMDNIPALKDEKVLAKCADEEAHREEQEDKMKQSQRPDREAVKPRERRRYVTLC